jgi:hypothetical protein
VKAKKTARHGLAVFGSITGLVSGFLGFVGHFLRFVGTGGGGIGCALSGVGSSTSSGITRSSGSVASSGSGIASGSRGRISSACGCIRSSTSGFSRLFHGRGGGFFSLLASGQRQSGEECDEQFGLHVFSQKKDLNVKGNAGLATRNRY